MRIERYLAAECLVMALALAGAALATRGLLHIARRGASLGERLAQARPGPGLTALAPLGPARIALAVPSLPRVRQDAAGSFMGQDDEVLIARMRTQAITRMKFNHGGSSLSFRVDFADGSRAAFKPAQTNLQTIPRKEVAAYRINRLLGLNAVAPATPRLVTRAEMLTHLHPETLPMLPRIRAETIFDPRGETAGVMMYWIPVIKDSGLDTPEGIAQSTRWLTHAQPIPPGKHGLAAQLASMLVFDFLIANPDRYSGGNMLTDEEGSRLYFMDNTMSFFIEPEGTAKTRIALHRCERFSRSLYQALGRIAEESLAPMLAQASEGDYQILTRAEIRAVVARRDYVKSYVDRLVARYGPEEVFFFP
ncbi:MAG: hypothetical protein ABSB49_11645 [Polyangia bacterium]